VFAFAEADETDGLRLTPEISRSKGDHRLVLRLNSRIRYEQFVEQGRMLVA
jgi:hypothetical protein